jgi:hypothetical protein
MTQVSTMPKMLFSPGQGFYCTYCDYYFYPELDRSGLPDLPVKWIACHSDTSRPHSDCPFEGKMFEIDITEVLPEAREVGKAGNK